MVAALHLFIVLPLVSVPPSPADPSPPSLSETGSVITAPLVFWTGN